MLKIGEFSKLSRVSIRMLRHYDEIGLLKPVETDPFTGYRYYSETQLPTVGKISALKEMGFSLADIIRILEISDDREKLDEYFVRKQCELQQQYDLTAQRDRDLRRGQRKGILPALPRRTAYRRSGARLRCIL